MRPILLTLQAFGPYAGTQTIDFRELGDRDVFLIHGQTGSGKTTILDGICYALYGKTSGDREARALRSDHADENTLTLIILEFKLSDHTYRIERTPEQMRPAKRGNSMTRHIPTAKLSLINSGAPEEEKLLKEGVRDVDEYTNQLLGLTIDQFRQVVLLPQNRFAEFIQSKASEREKIFETLFDTTRFKRLTDYLKDQHAEAKKKLDKKYVRKRFLLDQVEVEDTDALNERIETTESDLTKNTQEHQSAEKEREDAQKKLTEGSEAQKQLKEKEDATNALTELSKYADIIDLQRDELKKAQDAEAIRQQMESAERAQISVENTRRESAEATEAKAKAESVLAEHEVERPEYDRWQITFESAERSSHVEPHIKHRNDQNLAVEQAQEEQKQAQEYLVDLAKVVEDVESAWDREQNRADDRQKATDTISKIQKRLETIQQIDKLDVSLSVLEKNIDGQKRKGDEASANVETETNKAERAVAERELLEPVAAKADALQTEIKRLEGVNEHLAQYTQAQQSALKHAKVVEKCKQKLTKAEAQKTNADELYQSLQTKYRLSQAARLAQSLKADEPCPVCGSVHHPAPAEHAEIVADADVDRAEKSVKSASDAYQNANNEHQKAISEQERLETEISILAKLLGENASNNSAHLLSTLDAVRTSEREARVAGKRREELASEIPLLQQASQEASIQLQELKVIITRAESEFGTIQQQRETLLNPLPMDQRTEQKVNQSLEQANKYKQQLDDALELARAALESAHGEHIKAKAELKNADIAVTKGGKSLQAAEATVVDSLNVNGFKNEEEYFGALKTRAEIDQLHSQINTFEVEERNAQDKLESATMNLTAAKKAETTAVRQLNEDVERRDQAMAKHDFLSIVAWDDACRTEDETKTLLYEISEYDGNYAAAKDRSSRADHDATGLKAPDMEALLNKLESAKKLAADKHEAKIRTEEKITTLRSTSALLGALAYQIAEEERQYQIIASLSETAAGKSSEARGMTLHRYVLSFMLEQVLGIANSHLEVLSGGRYSLHRDSELERHRDGGLGILVYDTWTSEKRTADTLSGGETFLASLALALGLAEAVQQQAGAIALDTIFIDEGFGSLDMETVDLATDALLKLRGKGRLLGVISHVEAMRQQIPSRLEVTKTTTGSRVAFNLGD